MEQVVGRNIVALASVVGGASTIVQNAENGDTLGAIAGALSAAAAYASGDFGSAYGNDIPALNLGQSTLTALAAAAVGTSVADALDRGDVTSALITSLGPLLNAIASSYQDTASVNTQLVDTSGSLTDGQSLVQQTSDQSFVTISPVGSGTQIAALGGAFVGQDPNPNLNNVGLVLLQLAAQAQQALGIADPSALPQSYGSTLHSTFAALVNATNFGPGIQVQAEAPVMDGQVLDSPATPGSYRVDVLVTENGAPIGLFDLKTTLSPLTPSRAEQLIYALTGVQNSPIPVYDIRYNRLTLPAPTSLLQQSLGILKGLGNLVANPFGME